MKIINLKKYKLLQVLAIIIIVFTSCSKDKDTDPSNPSNPSSVKITSPDLSNLSVDENIAVGTQISAIDFIVTNSNTAPVLSLISQSPNGAVILNGNNLVVADSSIFDFETNTQVTGKIEASVGNVKDTADFIILINDIDETTPPTSPTKVIFTDDKAFNDDDYLLLDFGWNLLNFDIPNYNPANTYKLKLTGVQKSTNTYEVSMTAPSSSSSITFQANTQNLNAVSDYYDVVVLEVETNTELPVESTSGQEVKVLDTNGPNYRSPFSPFDQVNISDDNAFTLNFTSTLAVEVDSVYFYDLNDNLIGSIKQFQASGSQTFPGGPTFYHSAEYNYAATSLGLPNGTHNLKARVESKTLGYYSPFADVRISVF